jgi:hypothetical protein
MADNSFENRRSLISANDFGRTLTNIAEIRPTSGFLLADSEKYSQFGKISGNFGGNSAKNG